MANIHRYPDHDEVTIFDCHDDYISVKSDGSILLHITIDSIHLGYGVPGVQPLIEALRVAAQLSDARMAHKSEGND